MQNKKTVDLKKNKVELLLNVLKAFWIIRYDTSPMQAWFLLSSLVRQRANFNIANFIETQDFSN